MYVCFCGLKQLHFFVQQLWCSCSVPWTWQAAGLYLPRLNYAAGHFDSFRKKAPLVLQQAKQTAHSKQAGLEWPLHYST